MSGRAESPCLTDSDGDQPAETAGVEHDVRATQQDRPGDLAGILDHCVVNAVGAVLVVMASPRVLGVIRASGARCSSAALISPPRKVKARPGGARSDSNGSP